MNIYSLDESELSRLGRSFDQLMREIHGRIIGDDGHGDWITGPQVFREIYSRLGWHWAVRFSQWPLVRHAVAVGYQVFAKFRYRSAMKRWARNQANSCAEKSCLASPSSPSKL